MGGMVRSAREQWDGHVSLREAGEESPSGAYTVRLARIALVVVEMEGELSPQGVICAIFEFSEYSRGNKFVWSGAVLF